MVEARVPKFCGICGVPLTSISDRQGFDPFTGEPIEATRLYCNNPSVNHQRGLLGTSSVSYTYHPQWVSENGSWQQG